MDVQQVSRVAPGPLNLNHLQTQQFDDETSSISSLHELSPISPILPQQDPFSPVSTHERGSVSPSQWLHQPLNGGLFHGQSEQRILAVMYSFSNSKTLGTNVLRRTASERIPRRDSGIAFNEPNGLHNAKISAKAMDRAMRNEHRRPSPQPIQARSQLRAPKSLNAELAINAASQQGNSVRAGFRTNRTLDCIPSIGSLNRNEAKFMPRSSLLRRTNHKIDHTAVRFKNIEREDELTPEKILEGHLEKTFRVVPPPLSEGPKRKVNFVIKTGMRVGSGEVGRFGDVESVRETKEGPKKMGLWNRIAKRWKGWASVVLERTLEGSRDRTVTRMTTHNLHP